MHPYTFEISIRIKHPNADLSSLYTLLQEKGGFFAGRIWKAGEQRVSYDKKPLDGFFESSYCFVKKYNAPQDSTLHNLNSELTLVAENLQQFQSQFDPLLDSQGSLEVFVGLYSDGNAGFSLSPELSKLLATQNITLTFDLYPNNNVKDQA